jgi:PAS domain S-box-containing protein
MQRHTGTESGHWVKRVEEKTLHAARLNIGSRLILCFLFIILVMLGADAVVLWQFHLVNAQVERLDGIDQKLVTLLRVRTSLLAFYVELEGLAHSEDASLLVTGARPLLTAALEEIQRARTALSLLPFDLQRDPTVLPTLQAIQSALPPQLDAITTLATSGDWRAVQLRLANQVRPLETLSSALVEKVDHEAAEQRVQTVLNVRRVQRLVFLVVPITAVVALLIAAALGLAITRSITQPLARLVEGSKALARGEFQHQVMIKGEDELAHLGQVFNDTARRLRNLYAVLQGSEDRLRLVIDTIPAHVWSSAPDGSVDFINRRWLVSTGLSTENALGWNWSSVVHPDDLPQFIDGWHRALGAGESSESEARLWQADGGYRWFLIRNVPLRDESGNIVKWYGTSIDIEDRKQAEDSLRQSQAYLSEAQRLSHTGSFSWRVSSGEIFWSEEMYRIFQCERTTKPSVEVAFQRTHPEDALDLKQVVARASEDGKDFDFQHRLVMPDGSVKYVHVVAHGERGESGEFEFVGALMDVTAVKEAEGKIKRAEEALRQAQADLAHVNRVTTMGELTASLAHEVNQPLSAIVANGHACLRWLSADPPNLGKAHEAGERIIRDGQDAAEIVRRVRALFKRTPSEKVALNLNEVIGEVLHLLRSDATRRDIIMETDLDGNLPSVPGDRIQLQQVLLNLVLNGIESMEPIVDRPKTLLIRSGLESSGMPIVEIRDHGAGFKNPEKAFEAFFTTKENGMGMGLAICRSIIEAHHGHLWIASNEGAGAAVCFTVPLQSSAATDSDKAQRGSSQGNFTRA